MPPPLLPFIFSPLRYAIFTMPCRRRFYALSPLCAHAECAEARCETRDAAAAMPERVSDFLRRFTMPPLR
jgi:hypothetical protein